MVRPRITRPRLADAFYLCAMNGLYAQKLDLKRRKLEGNAELVQQGVASTPAVFTAHFSVSRSGALTWKPGTAGLSQVTIFDRTGKQIGTAGPPSSISYLRLLPDETRLLVYP